MVAEHETLVVPRAVGNEVATKEENEGDTHLPNRTPVPYAVDLTEDEDNDCYEDRLSPVIVREQRVAKARRIFGLNQVQHSRGDQVHQMEAKHKRTTDASNVLQLLHHADELVVGNDFLRLHVKMHHCDTYGLQRLFRQASPPPALAIWCHKWYKFAKHVVRGRGLASQAS